jgi:hypothetical protein
MRSGTTGEDQGGDSWGRASPSRSQRWTSSLTARRRRGQAHRAARAGGGIAAEAAAGWSAPHGGARRAGARPRATTRPTRAASSFRTRGRSCGKRRRLGEAVHELDGTLRPRVRHADRPRLPARCRPAYTASVTSHQQRADIHVRQVISRLSFRIPSGESGSREGRRRSRSSGVGDARGAVSPSKEPTRSPEVIAADDSRHPSLL